MGLNQQWSNEKLLFFTLDCLCQHLYRILHSKCVYFHSKCLNLYHQWVKLRKKWVNYYQEVQKSLCCFLLHRPYQGLTTVTQRSTTLLTQYTFTFLNVSPKGPSIYYVIQIWGLGRPLPPYCNIVMNWEDPLPPCNIVINWENPPYVMLKLSKRIP